MAPSGDAPLVSRTRVGQALLGVATAGLGVLSLGSGDFAYVWQPVPAWVPAHALLARLSGAVLLAGGAGMLTRRTRATASLALGAYYASWILLLHVPRIVANPGKEVTWSGAGEIALIVSGLWALLATHAPPGSKLHASAITGPRSLRAARVLFGVAAPTVGLSHFFYAEATAEMVPAWLPVHAFWGYLTGAGHLAAGLAVLVGLLPRLGATLEAVMVSTFVLLVHAPGVVGEPGSRLQWTMLCIASVIGGGCWLLAGSYDVASPSARPPASPAPRGP